MLVAENGVFVQPVAEPDVAISFKFTGDADEYFKIWIVNLCLTILTLGIYSAWAKVRNKRYFYGNTLLNDSAFDYLANPVAIFKGRMIALALIFVVGLAGQLTQVNFFWLVYILIIPFVVIKSAMFNAVNSAYRSVRFKFGVGFAPRSNVGLERYTVAGYRETSQFMILPVFLVPLSFGLLYPYYVFRKRQFFLAHSAFGQTEFWFDGRWQDFYRVYFRVAVVGFTAFVGSTITLGLGALPLFAWFKAYHDAHAGKLSWQHTGLAGMRFECSWQTGELFKLYLLNNIAILFTFGLMTPWAKIRTARYQTERLALYPAAALTDFIAAAQDQVSALGDEAGDLMDWDFGL